MTEEEIKIEDIPDDVKTAIQTAALEDKAKKIGWNPDYKGENAITAGEYIDKSREIQDTMKDYMGTLKTEISTLKTGFKGMSDFFKKSNEADRKKYEQEIKTLKAKKLVAIEEADVDKVTQLDTEIDDLRDRSVSTEVPEVNEPSPEYNKWHKSHDWYESNVEMTEAAEAINEAVKTEFGDISETLRLRKVTERIKRLFPDKFKTKAPTPPAQPEGSGNPPPVKSDKFKPTPQQKEIYQTMVDNGVELSEEEYYAGIQNQEQQGVV